MCGIVGITSSFCNGFTEKEVNMFRYMLFVDTLRGWDSTGTFLVENNHNVLIKKAAISAPDFIRTRDFKDVTDRAEKRGNFLIGHNRAATRGSINDNNAHPFWVDDKVVLVQNGTYYGSHKHHKDVEVDTEAVAHVVAENPDVETALQKINAAYALVWYDLRTKTLNLIRNTQRPLWLVETSTGGYAFASEEATIYYAAMKAGVELKEAPFEITPSELHTFTQEGEQGAYTCNNTKININYVSQQADSPFLPEDQDGQEYWYNYWRQRAGHSAENSTKYQTRVEKTLYDYVVTNKFKEYAVSEAECLEIRDWKGTVKDTIAVEFVEYLAASNDPNNRDWYVYGTPLRTDPTVPNPVVYLRLTGLEETEVLDFVLQELYTVTITQGLVRHTINRHKEGEYSIMTMFCTNPQPIPLLTKSVEANVH